MSNAERIVHIDMSRYTESQARKMIASAVEAIRSQAIQLAPVDGGNLRRSFSTRIDGLEGEVSNSAHYAPHVEYGTKPHDINSAVHIRNVGWRYITHHPGTAAQPFMRPAFDSVARRLEQHWGRG